MWVNNNNITNSGLYHMCRGAQVMITRFAGKSGAMITRGSRCRAGEPKYFPFAIAFVLIIKITLTCKRGFPNGNGS